MESTFWQQHYHPDMMTEIDTSRYLSLIDYFEQCVDQFPDNIAFECMDRQLTYAHARKLARDFCGWLQLNNIGANQRVAIMLPNCLSYPVTMIGTLYSGATVTNLNPLYTAEELHNQLIDSQASVIVVLENFARTAEKAVEIGNTNVKHIVISKITDFHSPLKAFAINTVLKYISRKIPKYNLPQAKSLKQILSQSNPYHPVELTHDTLAFLQYTGGTTGKPKGAMLTHGNMIANILQCIEFLKLVSPENGSQHRMITALPLYHIFSMVASLWMFFICGARNVFIPNPRDLKSFVSTYKKVDPTFMAGVNTLFNLLMKSETFRELDFSSLQCALAGGMTVQKSTAQQWVELTKTDVCQGYGLTEASPVVSVNIPLNTPFNGTIGYPCPSTDIKIVDDTGKPLDIEEPGELWIKGPQVMKGYWQQEEATKDTITEDGWLKTGDIAILDQAGRLSIVDRKKHIIIVSGFNVYPCEVEDVLTMHPEISECAVLGMPSNKTGESVRAYIVRKEGSNITADEINTFSRKHLTAYKSPDEYIFKDELPKTSVGKIDVKVLKQAIAEELKQ